MPYKYCCVPKCINKHDKCYRITTIKGAQEIWIQRIGNPNLLKLRNPSSALICSKHFHPECIGTDGKLKKFALPTLNLPEYVSSPQNEDLFLYSQMKSNSAPPGKNQDSMETTLLDEVLELNVQIPRKVYNRDRSAIAKELSGHSGYTKVLHLSAEKMQSGTGSSFTGEDSMFHVGETAISKSDELIADVLPS